MDIRFIVYQHGKCEMYVYVTFKKTILIWIGGQPGLQSEFQDNQDYTDKHCIKKQTYKTQINKKINKLLIYKYLKEGSQDVGRYIPQIYFNSCKHLNINHFII